MKNICFAEWDKMTIFNILFILEKENKKEYISVFRQKGAMLSIIGKTTYFKLRQS